MGRTESGTDPVAMLEFFRSIYKPTARIPRDRELERYLILRSKVELALLASLVSRNSTPWQEKFLDTGTVFCFVVTMRNHFACPNVVHGKCSRNQTEKRGCAVEIGKETERKPNITTRDQKLLNPYAPANLPDEGHFDLDVTVSMASHGCTLKTNVTGEHNLPYPLGERAGELHRYRQSLTDFLYNSYVSSCLAEKNGSSHRECVEKCREMFADKMTRIVQKPDIGGVGVRLLHLLCLVLGFADEKEGMNHVANCLKISDDLFSFRGWLDGRRGWHQHEQMVSLGKGSLTEITENTTYYSEAENKRGYTVERIIRDPANRVILPITAWTHERAGFRYYLNLPPVVPLLINLPEILANRDATVVLTSSIEIAEANNFGRDCTKVVWSAWYGEAEAVPRIDWTCLKGRQVFYLIAPDPHCPPEPARDREYDTAHAVYRQLSKLPSVRLVFVEMAEGCWGGGQGDPFEGAAVWPADEFVEVYRRLLSLGRPPAKPGQFTPRSMKEIVAHKPALRPYVLAPVIAEETITLMYARTGIGKTWLALSLAAAVAHGTVLFGEWRANAPGKVLYVDSEMTSQTLQTRIGVVSRMTFGGKRLARKHHSNFLSISRNRSASDIEKFKKEVTEYVASEGVKLVVLDNLTAFTQHNDSAKAWEETHAWIDTLRELKCAILVVHHENRAGGQRGTSATTNAVDNVLHLVDPKAPKKSGKDGSAEPAADGGNELVMKVMVEKGRDIHGAAARPFLAVIAPDARRPYCERRELPEGDSDYAEVVPTEEEKGTARRAYRRTDEQKESLRTEVLAQLAEGLSVGEAADALGVSRSRVYRIPGLTGSDAFQTLATRRKEGKKDLASRVFARSRKGESVREIAGDERIPASTVRRFVDMGWTAKIKECLKDQEEGQPEAVAKEIGCNLETVSRLMAWMRSEAIPELRRQNMTAEKIAEQLDLDPAAVLKICRREDRKEEEAKRRRQEMDKVRLLHERGDSESQIVGLVDLPRQAVTREIGRLRREKMERDAKD